MFIAQLKALPITSKEFFSAISKIITNDDEIFLMKRQFIFNILLIPSSSRFIVSLKILKLHNFKKIFLER